MTRFPSIQLGLYMNMDKWLLPEPLQEGRAETV